MTKHVRVANGAALIAGVMLASGHAAEAPTYDWSGPYVGLVVGGALSDDHVTGRDDDGYKNAGQSWRYALRTSILGGVTAGYNAAVGPVILGVEGEVEYIHLKGSGMQPAMPGNAHPVPDTTSSTAFDPAMGIVAGRIGLPVGRALLYLKAGGAVLHTKSSVVDNCSTGGCGPDTITATGNKLRIEPAGGAGIEYALTDQLSIRAEYLWIGAREQVVDNGIDAIEHRNFSFTHTVNGGINTLKIGLNYHFAVPVAPPPLAEAPPMPAPAPIAVTPPTAASPAFLVFFDFDRATLTPDGRKVVDAAARYAKANGKATIDVTGYTDLSGTVAYNLRLSERRAHAVALHLEGQGIPKSAISEAGRGKSDPRVPTADGVREPQNRRVEIVMP